MPAPTTGKDQEKRLRFDLGSTARTNRRRSTAGGRFDQYGGQYTVVATPVTLTGGADDVDILLGHKEA